MTEELNGEFQDLWDMPSFLFRVLENKSNALFQNLTVGINLTTRQFGVLFILAKYGSISQIELSDRVSSDKSTVGEMVARMVQRRLLTRTQGEDKRAVMISITDEGRELVAQVSPLVSSIQRTVLESLPEEYRPLFVKCLKILAESNFESSPRQ